MNTIIWAQALKFKVRILLCSMRVKRRILCAFSTCKEFSQHFSTLLRSQFFKLWVNILRRLWIKNTDDFLKYRNIIRCKSGVNCVRVECERSSERRQRLDESRYSHVRTREITCTLKFFSCWILMWTQENVIILPLQTDGMKLITAVNHVTLKLVNLDETKSGVNWRDCYFRNTKYKPTPSTCITYCDVTNNTTYKRCV